MAGMMTERSAALSKDPELAQRLLRQEQQNYIQQGEETEEDFFRAGQQQQSSREKAGSEEVEESGDMGGRGVEELCTVSWKEGEEISWKEGEEISWNEGEEAISGQEEQDVDVKEVDLPNDEEGDEKGGAQLFSQSGDAASAIVQK